VAWLLLKIEANDQNADAISDVLMELGALSASIEDAHAETLSEQAIFGEPGDPPPGIWQKNIITALLEESSNTDALLNSLKISTGITQFSYTKEVIAEQDWVRATQAQFDPIHITDKLWIVPTWHEAPSKDALNIILDPGLAFGTGSHPTTHLCLEWLTHQRNLSSVLDYGSGSGILAIAAKKLGAQHVVGVDIDEQAIISGEYNAKQNHVDIAFFDANTFEHETFDFIVANILSSALMVLAPVLAKYCNTGGKIALSGILEVQTDALVARYSEWFTIDAPQQKDAWILLTGTKK
jgi:ribosomal protein L11 methyltransferase